MEPDRLRELLTSPLDDPQPGRRKPWFVAVVAAVVAVVAVVVLMLGDGGDGSVPATVPPGSVSGVAEGTETAVPLPGVAGAPSAGSYHQLVFDPATERIVLTGGLASRPDLPARPGPPVDGTWAFDAASSTWFEYPTSPTPARAGYAAAHDGGSGRIVLFGGGAGAFRICGASGPCGAPVLGDTWLLDPLTGRWEEASPPTAPSPRYGAAMAYAEQSGRLILFGGAVTLTGAFRSEALGDTWAYDVVSDEWTELLPAGDTPPARAWHRMAYQPNTDRILLFGGAGGDELDARVWSYDVDANRWEASAATGPDGRWTPIVGFDTASNLLVVVAGQGPAVRTIGEGVTSTELRWRDDVWTYDPVTGVWTELAPLDGPVPWASGAYHPGVDRLVAQIFEFTGLLDADADAWSWIDTDPE